MFSRPTRQRMQAPVRTFDIGDCSNERVLAAKGSTTVSVCIPCRNEQHTVGPIIEVIRRQLVDELELVDEVMVLDDRSTDHTAQVAHDAGATVVHVDEANLNLPPGRGKGNVLWTSVAASKGDLVVWCDGDVTSFTSEWIVRLVAPLLLDPSVAFVKGFYERPVDAAGHGGGRTTELAARPMLSLLFPQLAQLFQPLGGEAAGRRTVLEEIPFVQGWGVEVGLLIEVLERFGASAISQVDLGTRRHRHRPLSDLSVQAAEIIVTLLQHRPDVDFGDIETVLRRPDGTSIDLNVARRPPLASLDIR